MATNFPLSASVGQEFNGYTFNGIAWEINGEDWKPFSYSSEEPPYSEPGFIWVDSDEDVPEVDIGNFVTASGYFTLTNKTISGSSNYFDSIPQEAISGLQNTLDTLDTLPSQSGNNGKYLTTDGSSPSWATLDLSTKQDVVSGVSSTEIGYLDGVTSAIQTQIDSKTDKLLSIVAEKTSNYTIANGDQDKLIQLNGTFTVSVPEDSTYNFAIGTQINLLNTGSGEITVAAINSNTTTLNGTPGLKLRAQWSSATLIKRKSDSWVLVGDLKA